MKKAEINVNDADLIITVGTSLKVLTAYKVLWPKKTKIVVINLQWTPKTKKSVLAINEKRNCFENKILLTNKNSFSKLDKAIKYCQHSQINYQYKYLNIKYHQINFFS